MATALFFSHTHERDVQHWSVVREAVTQTLWSITSLDSHVPRVKRVMQASYNPAWLIKDFITIFAPLV